MILAIDPGTTQSGWVLFHDGRVLESHVADNADVLGMLPLCSDSTVLAIEMIESYGMPVGREVFETVRWTGRFQQAWHDPEAVRFVPRRYVKMLLCGTPRAKDGNVRQALIDRLGPPGTKAKRGPTYGVKSHAWAALGVAVAAAEGL